ncbi:MAG: MarR family transcriptional regulator [Rhodospirillales bacterium]|jgi:DNA-binding MarR family transcriptional regulator|nr:MarR family transcriptional regulator [Rhodospirillales bacterium]
MGMTAARTYYEMIHQIERLHRRSLDLLKLELDRLKIDDINNVQSLILYVVGTDQVTVGELTVRGYYLGSNVSYNVKRMVANGYLTQERVLHDRRSVRVKVSEKGLQLRETIDAIFKRHADALDKSGFDPAAQGTIDGLLQRLEQFWTAESEAIQPAAERAAAAEAA